jgi:hypothetical protein
MRIHGVRAIGGLAVVVLGWLLAPSTASACDVGLGYKPTVSLGGSSAFGTTCSAGRSMTGVVILAVLVALALTALASSVLKRARVQAESLEGAAGLDGGTGVDGAAGPTSADRALDSYLESVGLGGRSGPPGGT